MIVKTADFVISNSDYKKCPKTDAPEYAFIGRSNVGKSSLINMLTGRTKLAKISGKPGKTQLINHFQINEEWYLVDLPGYGWASVSKQAKSKWENMIRDYINHRENLTCLLIPIDVRHTPQEIDIEFINWCGEKGIPFVIVFTKSDKVSNNSVQSLVAKYKKRIMQDWEEMPQYFVTSAEKKRGREEILEFIHLTNLRLKS